MTIIGFIVFSAAIIWTILCVIGVVFAIHDIMEIAPALFIRDRHRRLMRRATLMVMKHHALGLAFSLVGLVVGLFMADASLKW